MIKITYFLFKISELLFNVSKQLSGIIGSAVLSVTTEASAAAVCAISPVGSMGAVTGCGVQPSSVSPRKISYWIILTFV